MSEKEARRNRDFGQAMISLRRRTLLKTLPVAAAVKGTLIGALLAPRSAGAAETDPVERLLAVLPHRRQAAAVGQAYAAIIAAEPIGPHLLDSVIPAEQIATATTSELRDLLRALRREDFREGRTVTVEGWVLSVTEARLCALAWCSQSAQTAQPIA